MEEAELWFADRGGRAPRSLRRAVARPALRRPELRTFGADRRDLARRRRGGGDRSPDRRPVSRPARDELRPQRIRQPRSRSSTIAAWRGGASTARHAGGADDAAADARSAQRARRLVRAAGRLPTPIYERDDLDPGHRVHGPAVIEQMDTTTLVMPGTTATIDAALNLILERLMNAHSQADPVTVEIIRNALGAVVDESLRGADEERLLPEHQGAARSFDGAGGYARAPRRAGEGIAT